MAAGRLDADVVAGAEVAVLRLRQQPDVRELARERGRAAVVVHHDELRLQRAVRQRAQVVQRAVVTLTTESRGAGVSAVMPAFVPDPAGGALPTSLLPAREL